MPLPRDMPTIKHWQACKRVLRYLQATSDYGLEIVSSGLPKLTAYSDADWGSHPNDCRSVRDYFVFFGNNLIPWSSKKQNVVARSSVETEYRALAFTCSEVVRLKSLLQELRFLVKPIPIIWYDNQSAEALAINHVFHSSTKHIELDVHFIRDKITNNKVEVRFVPTADIFIKPFSCDRFVYLRNKLLIYPKPSI